MLKCVFCGYVGPENDFEIDHSIPLSRLTGYIAGNLKMICSGCNRQKGNMTDREYIAWRILNLLKKNYGPIKK